MPSVLKEWVQELTLAEQGTLLTCVRGPDNARKEHPTKTFVRAYRRAILWSSKPPSAESFMAAKPYLDHSDLLMLTNQLGRSAENQPPFERLLLNFWETQVDDVPHHWLMHFAHCAQIVGQHYPPPDPNVNAYGHDVRGFWRQVYEAIVASFHMEPEPTVKYNYRLRDRGQF